MTWIPVSERLPEEGQIVLITIWSDWSYGHGTDIETEVDIATFNTRGGYIPVDKKYSPDGGYFDTNNDWIEGQPCKVLAWMPLPVPYEEVKKCTKA